MTMAFLDKIGPLEVLLFVVVILLLFGARRLPELFRAVGKSMGEFKKGKAEGESPDKDPVKNQETDNDTKKKQGS